MYLMIIKADMYTDMAGEVQQRERLIKAARGLIYDRNGKYNLEGVKIDEDYRRYYPYGSLASKVMGFTGSDNQGILELEAKYDSYMMGIDGRILTLTDAKGIEDEDALEVREEPNQGNNSNG